MVKYNTDINIIGSIPDYELIFRALELFSQNSQELEVLVIGDNYFDFRSEKSRKRFLSGVYSAFLSFENEKHKEIFLDIFNSKPTIKAKQIMLFWQFLVTNKLFFEITKNVFIKSYFSGRVSLPKDDIVAFIKDLISKNDELKNVWSQVTVETIASKYLTILKKLELLEGSSKKSFKNIQISNEELLIFIYLIKAIEPELPNFLNSKYIDFIFTSKDNLVNRIKQLAKKDLFEMSFSGDQLKIEMNRSYKGMN